MFHQFVIRYLCTYVQPIPVAGRSKVWVCSRSLAGIAGSIPVTFHGYLSFVSVVFCQVEVSASSWSLAQRSPTDYRVSEYDREASIMKKPWPTGGVAPEGWKIPTFTYVHISIIYHSFLLRAIEFGKYSYTYVQPIPVAGRSKLWVCFPSLFGIAGSIPVRFHGYLSLVSIVFCQVEVSASSWSLVQMSPTDYGVSECDREGFIRKKPWPTRGCCARRVKNTYGHIRS